MEPQNSVAADAHDSSPKGQELIQTDLASHFFGGTPWSFTNPGTERSEFETTPHIPPSYSEAPMELVPTTLPLFLLLAACGPSTNDAGTRFHEAFFEDRNADALEILANVQAEPRHPHGHAGQATGKPPSRADRDRTG